jgi:hypothetical protein
MNDSSDKWSACISGVITTKGKAQNNVTWEMIMPNFGKCEKNRIKQEQH